MNKRYFTNKIDTFEDKCSKKILFSHFRFNTINCKA